METVDTKHSIENLHLQAFNHMVKDLLDLKTLYLDMRLSGRFYTQETFDAAFREQQMEVRRAALNLFYALGLKFEWAAFQHGLADMERKAFSLDTTDELRTCKKCGDRLTNRRDGVCEACFQQYMIDKG